MRIICVFSWVVLFLFTPTLAAPVELTGTFMQVQPDAVQGQAGFFGPGAILQTTGGAFYVQAVGPDGRQFWQLIPLDWQWTVHAVGFHLLIDEAGFTLSGVGAVNPFGATVVGPTDHVVLSFTGTTMTVSYLGWPVATGEIDNARKLYAFLDTMRRAYRRGELVLRVHSMHPCCVDNPGENRMLWEFDVLEPSAGPVR